MTMDILEFRLRVIMALRMAGLSEAQAEDEARANLVTLAAVWGRRNETPSQVAQVILNRRRVDHDK